MILDTMLLGDGRAAVHVFLLVHQYLVVVVAILVVCL